MEKFLPEDSTSLMFLKKKTKVSSEVIESDKKRKKRDKSYKRFFPAIFTKENKNNNYEKVQLNECRQQDRYYTHFQRHDRLNKCSNSLYLKKDGNVNANVNSSLSGSIIEERINEIKHDLFPVQGNISISIPENFALQDNIRTRKLHSRKYAKFSNSYLDDCFNSLNIDIIDEENKYIVDGHISDSPDMRNLKHSKSQLDEKINECVLKRKYSFQESMISPFRQNCETFGRISTPPNERFFIRPRAIHPTDRPLPAVPQKIKPTNDYCNISHLNKPNNTVIDINKEKPNIRYASQEINTHASDRNTNRNLQSKTDTPNSLENSNRQLNYYQTETNFRCSSTTNSKFGDYADSSYIANSSHKSELSPNSSKSGEYYVLNSPYTNNQTSPNDSLADLHIEKISQHTIVKINKQESLYDKIPPVTQFAITLENDRQELLGHNESNKTELVYSETTSEKNSTLYNLNTSNQYDKNESKQQKREKSDLKRYNRQSEYNYNQNRNYLSSVKKQHYVNNDNLEIFHSTAENVLANNELYNDDYLDEKLIIPELQNSDKKSCHSQESQPNDQILITSPQKDETSIYNVHSSSKSESNHAFSSVSETKNIHTFINDSSTISLITCNSPDMLRIINRQQPESPCNNNYQRPEPIYIYSSSSKPSSLLLEKDKINYSDINELCKKKILVQIHSSESINQPKFLHPQIKNKQDSQRKEIYIEKTFQKQSESKKKLKFMYKQWTTILINSKDKTDATS